MDTNDKGGIKTLRTICFHVPTLPTLSREIGIIIYVSEHSSISYTNECCILNVNHLHLYPNIWKPCPFSKSLQVSTRKVLSVGGRREYSIENIRKFSGSSY